MGFLRIFLAAIVLGNHLNIVHINGTFLLLNGGVAVASFFVISGFYMSLILNEKYVDKNNSYYLFISNRILRLFPMYWAMLIIALLIYLPKQPPMSTFHTVSLLCKQVFIICDPTYFTVDGPGGYLFIAPAWSVGIEILFYLIAPFFLRSKLKILFLFLISFYLKFFFNHSTVSNSLIYFTFGAFAYLFYKQIEKSTFIKNFSTKIVLALAILLLILPYQFIFSAADTPGFIQQVSCTLYYISLIFILPLLFLYTAKNKFDSWIGNFSYPIYITHAVILHITYRLSLINYSLYFIVSIFLILLTSYALITYIDNPIQVYRAKRVSLRKEKHEKIS